MSRTSPGYTPSVCYAVCGACSCDPPRSSILRERQQWGSKLSLKVMELQEQEAGHEGWWMAQLVERMDGVEVQMAIPMAGEVGRDSEIGIDAN